MSYTPNNEFGNIPLTGVLIPGITEGFVAESQYIKGGYIVVKTIEERDALLSNPLYEDRELPVGTPVFVSDENKTYRYVGESAIWVENTADLETVNGQINDLQQIALDINEQLNTKATMTDVEANFADVRAQLVEQSAQIGTKVDTEQFINVTSDLSARLDTKANISDIPTKVSELDNDLGFINANVNSLTNYYTKEEIDTQSNNDLIWDFDEGRAAYTIGGLSQGTILSGLSVKDILHTMLIGVTYPTFTDPSFTVNTNSAVGIANEVANIRGTITFNRGTIMLGDQLQNFRSGPMISYTIGETETAVAAGEATTINFNVSNYPLTIGETIIPVKVAYAAGPQPKDSNGRDYGSALPSGELETTITAIGLTNTWSGTSIDGNLNVIEVDNIHGTPITSVTDFESEGIFNVFEEDHPELEVGFQLTTPACTEINEVPVVLIQGTGEIIPDGDFSTPTETPYPIQTKGVTITGIKVWSDLTVGWEWIKTSVLDEATKESSVSAFKQKLKSDGTPHIEYRIVNHQKIPFYVYEYAYGAAGELHLRFYVT